MAEARRAMVVAPHGLASEVGVRLLKQGGNAYDAAIAVSATLGVVYPHMTGIGGDAFFLTYRADSSELLGYNGSGRAAKRATQAEFGRRGLSLIPERGALSAITVPGVVDAWWKVWSRYGSQPWAEVLAPAIVYAEEGFPVSPNLREWIVRDESWIRSNESMACVFLPGGAVPSVGATLRQPELARTLRLIQQEGKDGFYRGELAERIAQDARKFGGLLSEEDLASHAGEWVHPISADYRGYRVYQMPPNSQGFTALMMLNMLERYDMAKLQRGSGQFYHVMAEVVKLAFRDRDRYLTDPAFMDIPLDRLLSKAYAEQLSGDISPGECGSSALRPMGQDTAYAAVVDERGNAVSFIQSLYYDFGSCYMPEATGIILQNRGSYFSLDPLHPNALLPGKRSFHTLMPGMVFKDGLPYLLLGTQGGEGQPQTQLSILTGILDYGLSAQEALDLPRWVYGRTWGQDSDSLRIEGRIEPGVAELLIRNGHRLEIVSDWDGVMGQAQAIVIDRQSGLLHGAADRRGDGKAVGW